MPELTPLIADHGEGRRMTILHVARAYVAAGISVIPIARDGTKAPEWRLLPRIWNEAEKKNKPTWKTYMKELPSEEDLQRWFGGSRPAGIALVGGAVSGCLEQLDFDRDAEQILDDWSELADSEWPGLSDQLPVVRTPSGGYHVRYRCPEVRIPGNTKLAIDPAAPPDDRVLIETRGEGGYALAPGCPLECHPSGQPYQLVRGPDSIPTITAAQRECLIRCARSFTRAVIEPSRQVGLDLRPGDDFDRRGPDWADILEPRGWRCVHGSPSGERRWRRAGKDAPGWSATTGHCRGRDGADLLRVFSSNAAPFEDGKSYGKFRAYALLHHAGDLSAAADALVRQGYGAPRQPRPSTNGHAPNGHASPSPLKPSPTPVLIHLASVPREPVRWLMDGWIPDGTLSILDGDPGLGKSTLTLDLAARLSRGWGMPPYGGGDVVSPPAGVLLLGAEDSLKNTVGPRLDAAGADSDRIHYLDCVREGETERDPLLPWDLVLLEAWLRDHAVRLVIVDPLVAFIGAEFDAHKDQDIRRCLRGLRNFAERHGVAMLLLRHLNKLNGGSALYRGGGSIGIAGAARASMIVGRDPADNGTKVLAMNKINLAAFPRSLAYRIEPTPDGAARIAWLGETDLQAHDILWHHAAAAGGRAPGRPADQLNAAKELLNALLGAAEPLASAEIRKAALVENIAWRTIERAKADLDITTFKLGAEWYWQMPPDAS